MYEKDEYYQKKIILVLSSHSLSPLILGCCSVIKVSLANDVQNKQSRRAGTYQLAGNTNGRKYWSEPTKKQAIWYVPQYKAWAIGDLSDLGTTRRGMATMKSLESECPTDDSTWKYYSGSTWKATNDVQLECLGI